MIIRLSFVMNRTVVDSDSRFHLTTCAVEAPVTVNHNPPQDASGRTYSSYQKSHNMTHGFKQLLNPINVHKVLASII